MHKLNTITATIALLAIVGLAAILLIFPGSDGLSFMRPMGVCVLVALMLTRKTPWHIPGWWFLLPVAAALFALPFAVILRVFGSFDVLALVFHAQFGVEGATLSGFEDEIIEGAIAVFGILFAGYILARQTHRKTAIYCGIAATLVILNPLVRYGHTYASAVEVQSDLHTKLEAVIEIGEPEQRPDIIMVYLEGVERGYADRARYGDIFAPLEVYEEKGVSFTAVRQVAGTGWSLAGLVSTQCGLPLVPNGLRNRYGFQRQFDFLSDHVCLSDITAKLGYQNTFIFGGIHAFGGMDHFFRTHQVDNVIGYEVLRERYADVYRAARSGQILDDQLVFDVATTTYDDLADQDAPFLLMVETYGPHGSTSVLSRNCTTDDRAAVSVDVPAAIQCTLKNMVPFLDHVAQNRGDRPTVVILASDHLNHDPAIRSRLQRQQRSNTVIMYGLGQDQPVVPANTKSAREGTMLDIFPTILVFAGLADKDVKAGLGRSLFGEDTTLLEDKGLVRFDNELFPNPALSRAIWGAAAQ